MIAATAAALLAATAPGISVSPDPSGLPGTATLEHLLGGLQFDAVLAAIAAMIISAAVWALAAHSNNYQSASKGRSALLAAAGAALVIGFGPVLVQALFSIGQAAK